MIRRPRSLLILLLVFVFAIVQFAYPIRVVFSNIIVLNKKMRNSEIVPLSLSLSKVALGSGS